MLPVWLTDTVTSDLDRALHYTLLWGLEGVELRTVGSVADRVPFVNEEKLKRRLHEHEVPVAAVVPGLFEGSVANQATWLNEIVRLDETLAFCKRIGCRCIVASAFVEEEGLAGEQVAEALRQAGTKAAQRGILLAVLNEDGMSHATGTALATLLAAVDHPAVQAAWNPAAAVHAGEDPTEGLDALAGRVALVRCEDGILEGGQWTSMPLGEGIIGWENQITLLRAQGFEGPISLNITLEPRPRHGLRMASQLIQWIRST
ncbi:MAG TPA: sugar phosphate isomerase/epimerase family protein [Rhodothermales bacterium]|nr:sugar phosphate isomerase/epimerase family protein [Rhodothermales bacterium]